MTLNSFKLVCFFLLVGVRLVMAVVDTDMVGSYKKTSLKFGTSVKCKSR